MIKKFLIALFIALLVLPRIVFAAFDMTIEPNQRSIDFGRMDMGEEKTLEERGGYEHMFSFVSTNNRIWHFKAQLLRPFTSGVHTIPAENFEWVVDEIRNGQGSFTANISQPSHFSTLPVLIYISSGADNTGATVQIKLKYKLKIPKYQAAGAYTAQIRFIMMEAL
ncbi:MAG: hypothetical protein JW994_06860 [Candidatus Omnitrophica bacterium]|nr:hypothetical protein [Candidatus Omnitrophota bacterium]